MYTGADFLIDKDMNIYLSEVNTGLPGGAQEYDLIHRLLFNRASGVFLKIEKICREQYKKPFKKYIRELSFFKDLKTLKIWMDEQGPPPVNPDNYLRLEDKWVQYLVLSGNYPVIPTVLFNKENLGYFKEALLQDQCFILKRRFGRGGRGFRKILNLSGLDNLIESEITSNFYIQQPYLNSTVKCGKDMFRLSLRALSFAGKFICMYANISKKVTSNHGFLFYVNPDKHLGIKGCSFNITLVTKRAWEAHIFFGKDMPDYLYHNLNEEQVSDSVLNIPQDIYEKIIKISTSISRFYMELDASELPKCYLEEEGFNDFPDGQKITEEMKGE